MLRRVMWLVLWSTLATAGHAHAQDAEDLHALSDQVLQLYREGKYGEAVPMAQRAVALAERLHGLDDTYVAAALQNLALLYLAQGRHADAEPIYRRSLAIREKALGPDHADVGQSLNDLAGLHAARGRYPEAEALYRRSLAIREKALGPENPSVAMSLNNLAEVYRQQGRYADAEPLYKRSLAIREKVLGPGHSSVATSLNNLAWVYDAQGRYADAERLYQRALAIREKELGPEHVKLATSLNNLAALYRRQGRYVDAEPLYQRALAIREKALGPEHPNVAVSLNNLAFLYREQGRHPDAERLYRRSLAISRKALGPGHPNVAISLNNLAFLHRARGRHAEAEQLYKRSLAIREMALGPDHPDVGVSLNNLAALYFARRDWAPAAEYWRRSTELVIRRTRRGAQTLGAALTGEARAEAERQDYRFRGLVRATYRLARAVGGDGQDRGRAMLQTAQWAQSSDAAAALARMAARNAKGDGPLATLVRERQDLVGEWQEKDKLLIAARSNPANKRSPASERLLADRLAAIDARIAIIDATLRERFPDYAALASPEPLSVEEIQAGLRPDEALVVFLDTPEWTPAPEETFIWLVTKSEMRWVRSELGKPSLAREVAALRCGLDHGAWAGSRRFDLTGQVYTEADHTAEMGLPFDLGRAHRLYRALFGEIENLIVGKHLLIVPSGALTQLPFHVLLSRAPDPLLTGARALRRAKWLVRSHAITILPAVSSLKALRRDARASRAAKPYFGVGNPLLDGPDGRYASLAAEARAKQACPAALGPVVAGAFAARGVSPVTTRGGPVDLGHLRVQAPLPETADELCAVARDLKVGAEDMRLGGRASESHLKELSERGRLTHYRVLHFATHGALAGEIQGGREPGLILSPPQTATERDDGYLSASEIAGLKLDADWVILSACNTAAGSAEDAEALSGLARAFFYAGARALLVSHWAVYSDTTVKLITNALSAMATDASVGRAEALRRSMLTLIDTGAPHEAHPSHWAPFVVVGEGSMVR